MRFRIIRQHSRVLGNLFLLKFIADTVDILYTNTAFMPGTGLMMNPSTSSGHRLITCLILGLPQAIAVYLLFKQSGMKL